MKRIIRAKSTGTHFILSGIQLDQDMTPVFNWTKDSSNDVVSLANNTSGEFNHDGVRYVYGYKFNDGARNNDKRIIRSYLKNVANSSELYTENIEEFVENGILQIEKLGSFNDFQITVHIESSKHPSLVDVMESYLMEYMRNKHLDFTLIKLAYAHVEFDVAKAKAALRSAGSKEPHIQREIEYTLNKFEDLKQSGQLFQMKRFIPKEIREGFFNFLKFKTEEERKAYESLQGVNVLIYDDFLTSGATVREVIRYLRAIHDKNTLTVFVLVKQ